MTTGKIKWVEELPPTHPGRKRGVTQEFVEALKQRPGKWAVYKTLSDTTRHTKAKAWTGNSRYAQQYPGTQWAARTVNGKVVVYARWIGQSK